MALPPTIPTSFVPYPASAAARRFRPDYGSAFNFFAFGVLGVAILLALGVFAYGHILASTQASKDAALAKAEANIDLVTVESFVRLRNRLSSSQALLNNHVAFSNFFSVLGNILPATARLTALHLTKDGAGRVNLNAAGVAKSFNALAAVSNALAADGRIKDAIFSNIVVSPTNNTVSFVVTAMLDPKIIAFAPAAEAPPPAATTTEPSL